MQPDKFASRHIGPNEDEISKMLSALEVDSIEELLSQTLPEEIRLKHPLTLREGISEYRFLNELRALSDENQLFETYIGMGYHPTYYSSGHTSKHTGKPGLVYCLHTLSSRNCAGEIRSSF